MSLRALLLGAFAYVLVLVLLALGVPLGSNLSRRVDAEVKAQAAGQAGLIAATAAGRLRSGDALEQIVGEAGDQVRGRVIVVDDRGRLLADSASSRLRSESYRGRSGPDGPPGTGLGLSIVDTLARRWGGRAWIFNRPEGGAGAGVALPAAPVPLAGGGEQGGRRDGSTDERPGPAAAERPKAVSGRG